VGGGGVVPEEPEGGVAAAVGLAGVEELSGQRGGGREACGGGEAVADTQDHGHTHWHENENKTQMYIQIHNPRTHKCSPEINTNTNTIRDTKQTTQHIHKLRSTDTHTHTQNTNKVHNRQNINTIVKPHKCKHTNTNKKHTNAD